MMPAGVVRNQTHRLSLVEDLRGHGVEEGVEAITPLFGRKLWQKSTSFARRKSPECAFPH
jgi:hypothetical protein